jgi:hypothetical protein
MKAPKLFVLSRHEQQVVVLIVLALLLVAIAKHYHYVRLHSASPVNTTTQPSVQPLASPSENDRETSDESP